MKCKRCNGRKLIELDKIGLLVSECPDCNGTGEVENEHDSGIGQDSSTFGSGNPGQPKRAKKPRARKATRKKPV